MNIREEIIEKNPHAEELLFLDGYDDAIIGTATNDDGDTVICYSVDRMVDAVMRQENITYDEAMEWVSYNTLSAYLGKLTPIYIEDYKRSN
jgi:hypothetical protein